MKIDEPTVTRAEKTALALRTLYRRSGYIPYRMGKFEEYDLYSRNKDFLVSDSVITFTDTNGRLMALKPDVTLSIAKNHRDGQDGTEKLYYDENVYRVSRGSGSFREIRQAGLECIGEIDAPAAGEVLLLAAQSLETVSEEYVLDLAHIGILSAVLERITPSPALQDGLLASVGEKNLHGIRALMRENGLPEDAALPLEKLVSLYGEPDDVLPEIGEIARAAGASREFDFFRRSLSVFSDPSFRGKVRVDFSVTGDRNYYNGLIFKGFIPGLPGSVLSGGQYDNLMHKLGKKAGAVGFAVYLQSLEALDEAPPSFDADVMLLYGGETDPGALAAAAAALKAEGLSVRTGTCVPKGLRVRRTGLFEKGGITWQN
ncbi:MAG: ATP phosphoribosyltransferase regulatory subunit [Clostridia bacterium]|nr:ATP phosphoribosyltransferase regulatory subunit [Clostridia bacterium]